MPDNFITQKPSNDFLYSVIDYYFFIDIPVEKLNLSQEYIIPFPRITFGYFFSHPFLAVNQTLNKSASVNLAVSRISSHKIVVQPQSKRVKILGAHARPFFLAYLTKLPVHTLPWLIQAKDLFKEQAVKFQKSVDKSSDPLEMFKEMEKLFLDNLLVRDLSLITTAVKMIDESSGNIKLLELVKWLEVSDRTIRTHFYNHIGCSPKEYIRLVKLKQIAYQMKNTKASLTNIAYDTDYFDQSHFIHDVKHITGKSPKELKKEIPDFRFLQF